MAGTDWQTRHPLTTELLQDASQYSFYEAVRLLHGLHKDAPKVGYQGPPERERMRFRPLLSMSFPVADIAGVSALEQPDGSERYRLDLTFMGLYGPSTPLPAFYTEDLIRLEDDDSLIRGFLDLFHHRLFSFVYRVWEKYRHTVQYDSSGKDYYSQRLLTLIGTSLDQLPGGEDIRAGRLLAYAGLLTQQPRSAATLRAVAQRHPADSDELATIPGIGAGKLERYGELHTFSNQLLELTTDACESISHVGDQLRELSTVTYAQRQLNKENQEILLRLRMMPASFISAAVLRLS